MWTTSKDSSWSSTARPHWWPRRDPWSPATIGPLWSRSNRCPPRREANGWPIGPVRLCIGVRMQELRKKIIFHVAVWRPIPVINDWLYFWTPPPLSLHNFRLTLPLTFFHFRSEAPNLCPSSGAMSAARGSRCPCIAYSSMTLKLRWSTRLVCWFILNS